MNGSWFAGVLTRDLKALKREIEAYPGERDLWRVAPGIGNPGGTLALHLAGNLQYFVGAVLGRTGYRRDRDAEFQRRDLPRRELLAQVDAAIATVDCGLATLDDAALARDYPETVGGITVRTGDFLLHLVAHLTYHLGQVDYHRRLVTGQGTTVGAVPIGELRTARRPPA
ncbi:MAG: DinB family protein [Gemmatimonadales bacterium]